MSLSEKVLNTVLVNPERIHPSQKEAFAAKVSTCQSGIVLGNGSCSKVSGFALERVPGEKFVASAMSPDSFRCLVMSRIESQIPEKFFSEDREKKLEAISEACPQFSDSPIRGQTRLPNNADGAYWGHELGENGYVAVLVDTPPLGAPHLGGDKYVIVASVGAPLLVQDFAKQFEKVRVYFFGFRCPSNLGVFATQEGLTWKQVEEDARMQYLKSAVEKNARRTVYAAAEALGVKIRTGIENPDSTWRQDPLHEAPRRTAQPETVQFVSSIGNGIQYDHCAPLQALPRTAEGKKAVIVAASPFNHRLVTISSPVTVNSSVVPTDTGRIATVSDSSSPAAFSNPKLAALIGKTFTWEGDAKTNDRLNPAAYRQFDTAFFGQHFSHSGTDQPPPQADGYTTVIMKIPSRSVTRPN